MTSTSVNYKPHTFYVKCEGMKEWIHQDLNEHELKDINSRLLDNQKVYSIYESLFIPARNDTFAHFFEDVTIQFYKHHRHHVANYVDENLAPVVAIIIDYFASSLRLLVGLYGLKNRKVKQDNALYQYFEKHASTYGELLEKDRIEYVVKKGLISTEDHKQERLQKDVSVKLPYRFIPLSWYPGCEKPPEMIHGFESRIRGPLNV